MKGKKSGAPVAMPLAVELRALVRSFLAVRRAEALSPSTVAGDALHLERFVGWLERERPKLDALVAIDRAVLDDYAVSLSLHENEEGHRLRASTRHGDLISLRVFFRWLERSGRLLANPARDLPLPKVPQSLPRGVLSSKEVDQVLAVPDLETDTGLRARAILEVLYSTGVRNQELRNLKLDDLDFAEGLLTVREGKGRKDRVVPIGKRAQLFLKRYLDEVRPAPSFLSLRGARLSLASGQALFEDAARPPPRKRRSQSAGLRKPLTCHGLRHTCATHMLARPRRHPPHPGDARPPDAHRDPDLHARRRLRPQARPRALPPARARGMTLDCALERFVLIERSRGRSEGYLKRYAPLVRDLLAFLGRRGKDDLRETNEQDLVAFLQALESRCKASTVTNVFLQLRRFFAFLEREGLLLRNPIGHLRRRRGSRRIRSWLSENEVRRLLDAAPPAGSARQLRDRALLEVLYSCGLRVGELVALDLDDVDLAERLVTVRTSKNGRFRRLPIGKKAAAAVAAWLAARPQLSDRPTLALFLGAAGRRLAKSAAETIVRAAGERAGLAKRVTPHVLRHTLAVHLLRNGASTRHIQEMLGHRHLSSTQVYTHVLPEDLRRAHARSHPAERHRP